MLRSRSSIYRVVYSPNGTSPASGSNQSPRAISVSVSDRNFSASLLRAKVVGAALSRPSGPGNGPASVQSPIAEHDQNAAAVSLSDFRSQGPPPRLTYLSGPEWLHALRLQPRLYIGQGEAHVASDVVECDPPLGDQPTHKPLEVFRYSAVSETVRYFSTVLRSLSSGLIASCRTVVEWWTARGKLGGGVLELCPDPAPLRR